MCCPCFYLEHSSLSGVGDHQHASGRWRRRKEWKDWGRKWPEGVEEEGERLVCGVLPAQAQAQAARIWVAEQQVKKLSSVS